MMSEGISFNTVQEANNYIKQKQNEGYEAYYVKKDNKYKVFILGTVHDYHANIKTMKRDELYDPSNIAEFGTGYEGEDEIRFSNLATTREKTHEIGHLKLGHGDMPEGGVKEEARQEIEAEIYSYQKNGKDVNYRVALPALRRLDQDYKVDPKRNVFIIKDILKEKGIELPHDKEEYWINEYLK
jgi:hypothetical protein